jgi:hypothetical protein
MISCMLQRLVLRRHAFVIITVLVFACVSAIIYGRTIGHGFVNIDDDLVITANPLVREISFHTFIGAFTTFDPELYVPLTVLSLQWSWVMGGGAAWAFHLDNIALHTGNALLVAWLLSLLLHDRRLGVAAGLLFLVHPLNVEAVAWASARKDVLSVFLGLGSCIAYVHGMRGWQPGRRVSGELFALALLAKVSVAPLPLWFILFEWLEHRRVTRNRIIKLLPFFAIAAVFCGIALVGKPSGMRVPVWLTMGIGAKATLFYAWKTLMPTDLSIIYLFEPPHTLLRQDVLAGIGACVGAVILAIMLRRRAPLVSAGIAMYLVAVAPSVFNIAKGHDLYFASDRYAYLAMPGLLLSAAAIVAAVLHRRPAFSTPIGIGAAGIAVVFASMASLQAALWRDSATLFTPALQRHPTSIIALNNIASDIMQSDPVAAEQILSDALALHPNEAVLRMNLANAWEMQGRIAEAESLLRAIIDEHPSDAAQAWFRLGNLLAMQGKKDEAMAAFQESMAIDPKYVRERVGGME